MSLKIGLFLASTVFAHLSYAGEEVGHSPVSGAVITAGALLERDEARSQKISKDEITGAGFLPGTHLSLENSDGKQVSHQTVGSEGTFNFVGLPVGVYILVAKHRKDPDSLRFTGVKTGTWAFFTDRPSAHATPH